MSQTVSLDIEFDGNIEHLATAVRDGRALMYNGRPLPIDNVIVQADKLIVQFAHRSLIIDLRRAMEILNRCSRVNLRGNFEK